MPLRKRVNTGLDAVLAPEAPFVYLHRPAPHPSPAEPPPQPPAPQEAIPLATFETIIDCLPEEPDGPTPEAVAASALETSGPP
ncbi:MAG: hypothetical protein V4510_04580 [bacterium]